MNFFKDKEKQRFSLRKNKAYGLASALLGITVIGTVATNVEQIKPIVHMMNAQAAVTDEATKNVLRFNVANSDIKTITKNIKEHKPTDFLVVMEMSSVTSRNTEIAFLDSLIKMLDTSFTENDRVMLVLQGWKNTDSAYQMYDKYNTLVTTSLEKPSELKTRISALKEKLRNSTLAMDSEYFMYGSGVRKPVMSKKTLDRLTYYANRESQIDEGTKYDLKEVARRIINNIASLEDYEKLSSVVSVHNGYHSSSTNVLDTTHEATEDTELNQYLNEMKAVLAESRGRLDSYDLRKILNVTSKNQQISIQSLFDQARHSSDNRDVMLIQYLNTVNTTSRSAQDFYQWANDNQISSYLITGKQQTPETMAKLNHKYSTEKNFVDAVLGKTVGNNAISTTYEVQQATISVNVTPEEGLTLTSATLVKGDLHVKLPITNNRVDYQTQGDAGDYTVEYTFSGKPTTEKSVRSSVSVNSIKKDEHVNTVKPVEEQFNTTYEDDASLAPGATEDKVQGVIGLKYSYLKDGREVGTEVVRTKVDKVVRRGVTRDAILTFPGENLAPVRVRPTDTELPQLSLPGKPKPNHKFLGWSKDGKNLLTREEAKPGETIALQPLWQQVNDNTIVTEVIPVTTAYRGDNNLDYGKSQETPGTPGEKHIIATYSVAPYTGELKKLAEKTEIVRDMIPKVITKGTKPKVEIINRNGARVRKTTNYTVDPTSGNVSESVSYFLVKGVDGEEIANENSWEKRERLTDQVVPIEKITIYTMRPENGEVTTSVRYEIVGGQGAKKDTLDTIDDVPGKEVAILKKGHHVLNTETGKLTSTIQYARKDGQGNEWETRERLTDQELPIDKITKHTLNPETGDIAKEVHYEIVDGKGPKKDTFDKVENVNQDGNDLVKTTHFTLNVTTGKLSKDAPTFTKKSGGENVTETRERLTDQDLPIDKITKSTFDPTTGRTTKEVRYEIVDGKGPKKDTFDKVEDSESEGIPLTKTTHYTLNTNNGKLTKDASVYSRKDGSKENEWETVERLTDQELPINKITKFTLDPSSGTVTKEVHYEIVDGKGDKKDTFDKEETINKEGIEILKSTHFTLDTNSGKLTSASTYVRKDGSGSVWETRERLTDQELPIDKITKHTLELDTGEITKEVRYEIVDGKGPKKDTFDKKENSESNGVELVKTTPFTLNTETGKLTKGAPNYSRKEEGPNEWDTTERLTDQELPIDKFTKFSLNPTTGEVTKQSRYEIVDGLGDKKDHFDKVEEVNKNGVDLLKTTPFTLNTETGKLTKGASTFSRKDKQDLSTETRERLTDQELPIDKITKTTVDPNTGEVTKEVRYEIVDGLGDKKDHFNKIEEIDQNGLELIKTTPFTLNTETGKLTKGEPTFARKDGQPLEHEISESVTGKELPIIKYTKTIVNPNTGEVTKQIRYEIANGLGDKKDSFDKVEEVESNGITLIKTTHYKLNPETGELTKESVTFKRKDGKDNIVETVERLTDQELPIDKFTKVTLNPETGEVTIEVRYEIVDGQGDKKDTFDKVEEVEEQGIKIRKSTHYTLDKNGTLSKTVTYSLLNGKTEFDKVEILKRSGQTVETTTHYKLNPDTGKFEITTSEKVLTSNGLDENGNKLTAPTVDKPEYTEPVGGSNSDGEGGTIEVLKHEKPEYSKAISSNGVNDKGESIDPPTVDKPEYSNSIASNGVNENGELITPPTVDKPEYSNAIASNGVTESGESIDPPKVDKPEYSNAITSNGVNENGEIIEPLKQDKPEYNGVLSSNGVDENGNAIESLKQDKPEYSNAIASNGVNENGESIDPPKVDIPEYKGEVQKPTTVEQTTQNTTQNNDSNQQVTTQQKVIQVDDNEQKQKLPKTNAETLIGLTATGLLASIGAAFVKLRKKK